jgi:LysR family transcriptional regulator, transcriptional activator for bauABCD operon
MQGTVDLKRLKLFRQVVECGGLSAAEKVLNINLPTISAHLSSLEAKLGMRLCERGRKGFRLTQQGQRVLAACERLFEHVENFRSDISELSQQLAGSLRLGMVDNTISDPACRVVPALRTLRSGNPGLDISIDIRNPFELERALLEERIDMAVGPFSVTDPAIESYATHGEHLSLYIGRGHPLFSKQPLQLHDLAGLDCVMRGYLRESQVVQHHVSFKYSATAQNIEGIAHLVLTGHFVGYLPDHVAAPWVKALQMRSVLPELMSYDVPFKVIVPRLPRRTRASTALLQLLLPPGVAAQPDSA